MPAKAELGRLEELLNQSKLSVWVAWIKPFKPSPAASKDVQEQEAIIGSKSHSLNFATGTWEAANPPSEHAKRPFPKFQLA